jgi:hypothetical protein
MGHHQPSRLSPPGPDTETASPANRMDPGFMTPRLHQAIPAAVNAPYRWGCRWHAKKHSFRAGTPQEAAPPGGGVGPHAEFPFPACSLPMSLYLSVYLSRNPGWCPVRRDRIGAVQVDYPGILSIALTILPCDVMALRGDSDASLPNGVPQALKSEQK